MKIDVLYIENGWIFQFAMLVITRWNPPITTLEVQFFLLKPLCIFARDAGAEGDLVLVMSDISVLRRLYHVDSLCSCCHFSSIYIYNYN